MFMRRLVIEAESLWKRGNLGTVSGTEEGLATYPQFSDCYCVGLGIFFLQFGDKSHLRAEACLKHLSTPTTPGLLHLPIL